MAATKDIYAFLKKEQAATQQSKDEATCYGWAVTNTGSDSGSVIWVGTATAENHEDPDTKTV